MTASVSDLRSTSTNWSKNPWTTTAQCHRSPTGSGDISGVLLDGIVVRTRVHSVFISDNAQTKVPPKDLDTLLPVRFNVWTVRVNSAWTRMLRPSDGIEVDPTDRIYMKRRKECDPSPESLTISMEELGKRLSNDNTGKTVIPAGYISDQIVHNSLHPHHAALFDLWANVSNDNWKNVAVDEELRIKTLGSNLIVEVAERLNAKTIMGKNSSAKAEEVAAGWGNKLLAHAEDPNDESSDDERSGADSDEWD